MSTIEEIIDILINTTYPEEIEIEFKELPLRFLEYKHSISLKYKDVCILLSGSQDYSKKSSMVVHVTYLLNNNNHFTITSLNFDMFIKLLTEDNEFDKHTTSTLKENIIYIHEFILNTIGGLTKSATKQ